MKNVKYLNIFPKKNFQMLICHVIVDNVLQDTIIRVCAHKLQIIKNYHVASCYLGQIWGN